MLAGVARRPGPARHALLPGALHLARWRGPRGRGPGRGSGGPAGPWPGRLDGL